MKPLSEINRRHFMQIGALTAGAVLVPGQMIAAEIPAPVLPALPYALDALEPHIDAKTMEIHHGKHHAAYIAGLNAAFTKEPKLASGRLGKLLSELPAVDDEAIRTALRNHGGGHWNHSFFWKTLSPAASSGEPTKELASAIKAAFGSMDEFKKAFGEAATKRFGSGWAWLIVQSGKLKVTSTPNQDNPLMSGLVPDGDIGTPVLGLDVWEHAYYLHYQNRRPDYISAWWNVVNWAEVSKQFTEAGGKS